MPPRSKVAKLPLAVRNELERRIIDRGFSGYQELAEWLQQQGYEIAEDSVQRYGARLHNRIESLDLSVLEAKAVAHTTPADRERVIDSTIDLLNAQVLSTLIEAEQIDLDGISRLSRTICELSKTTIARQWWAREMNSLFPPNPEERSAQEQQAKTARAEAFAAVCQALLGGKVHKPDAGGRGAPPELSVTAKSQKRNAGEARLGAPQTVGK
jgi:hypothetical protein